jgi:type I restriction enzyme S subunit
MESEWHETMLAAVMDVKHGFAFPGDNIREKPPGDILLTPGNFAIGGGFKGGKFKYYDGEVPDDYVLNEGDLVVTMTDLSKQADTLGYPALVPKPCGPRFLHNQRLGKVLIKRGAELDKGFLFYLLRTAEYRHEVVASATGSTVKHTSPSRILAHRAMLPPLTEQKAIAAVLGALDEKIEVNVRMNATLEAIAQTLFQSWFVDFDLCKDEDPLTSPALRSLYPAELHETPDGVIPKGWKARSLDKMAVYLNGLALQKFPAKDGPILPVIKIAQLRKGDTQGADKCGAGIPPDYIIQDGDVLFSWSGSLEVELWCGGTGALNQHLFKVTSQEFPKWFYYLWTRHHLEAFRRIAASKATTMGHIQRMHLTAAKALIPSPKLLEVMTGSMEPLINKIIANRVQARTLAELRDTLLPKLLSGEVKAPPIPTNDDEH